MKKQKGENFPPIHSAQQWPSCAGCTTWPGDCMRIAIHIQYMALSRNGQLVLLEQKQSNEENFTGVTC